MSFLDKFKGKTYLTTKHDPAAFIGTLNTNPNNTKQTGTLITPSLTQPKTTTNKLPHSNQTKIINGKEIEGKNIKVSPFYIVNPFYLDELERQKEERAKREQEIRQRMEREKKKRKEVEARLAESSKLNKDKLSNKQWILMGGLGPNIGSEDWKKKSQLHNKMLDFAKQIKKVNFQKIKSIPFVSVSHLHDSSKNDSRSRAILYSRSVPKPHLLMAERTLEALPRSQSKQQINEMEKLDLDHIKYMQMIKKI